MQSTELFDKNKKEIFEGDIIESEVKKGVIEFGSGYFGINWDYGTDKETMLGSWGTRSNLRTLCDGFNEKIVVIGNICENLE